MIIDVLARVRPRGYGSDKYQLDYDALALQHPFSIPFDSDAPLALGMVMKRDIQDRQL